MNNITQIALNWLKQGIAPIPCHYRSKRPRVAWEKYQSVLPSEQLVKAWFAGEHTNLAIITGWNGLVVVDFDSMDAYELWLQWYADNARDTEQPMPIYDRTLRIITGRGVHLYLFVDEQVNSSHVQGVVDIKASGYVLTVPSIHPSGRRYISNGLDIARVHTLTSIIPAEWLEHHEHVTDYQTPPILSNDPLKRIDQSMPSLVETIRSKVTIQDLVHGTATRDGWLVGQCPFHKDHEPSFWIDTRRQLCGCYAGCTPKPLDVINLYARLNGVSNHDAITMMRSL